MFKQILFRAVFPASLFIALIGAAGAIAGPRGTQAAPVNGAVFEVGAYGSGIADDLWCGASDFARRYLGAGWKSNIYVVRGRGKTVVTSRTTAAHFTLDPAAAGVTPIDDSSTVNSFAIGYSMTVQRANTRCSMPKDLW